LEEYRDVIRGRKGFGGMSRGHKRESRKRAEGLKNKNTKNKNKNTEIKTKNKNHKKIKK
jgi:hypothetical protein